MYSQELKVVLGGIAKIVSSANWTVMISGFTTHMISGISDANKLKSAGERGPPGVTHERDVWIR